MLQLVSSSRADLRAHRQQPVNGLVEESHVVVGGDVPEHFDLLRKILWDKQKHMVVFEWDDSSGMIQSVM